MTATAAVRLARHFPPPPTAHCSAPPTNPPTLPLPWQVLLGAQRVAGLLARLPGRQRQARRQPCSVSHGAAAPPAARCRCGAGHAVQLSPGRPAAGGQAAPGARRDGPLQRAPAPPPPAPPPFPHHHPHTPPRLRLLCPAVCSRHAGLAGAAQVVLRRGRFYQEEPDKHALTLATESEWGQLQVAPRLRLARRSAQAPLPGYPPAPCCPCP
jgi:hypothetical protein